MKYIIITIIVLIGLAQATQYLVDNQLMLLCYNKGTYNGCTLVKRGMGY